MALTQEQQNSILSDLADGKNLQQIIRQRGLDRKEVHVWKEANLQTYMQKSIEGLEGRGDKDARLVVLNDYKDRITTRLAAVNARIAEVEAE
jgi:hypothetical protein